MLVIGITGSIGTGKSYITSCFKRLGYPVFNADHYVHWLMKHHQHAIAAIGQVFPDAIVSQRVSREKLRPLVKGNKDALKILETILHPLVRDAEIRFIRKCNKMRFKLAVMDIPLLYETGADTLCDMVLVTYVKQSIQQARVLKRGKMNQEFLAYIKKLQLEQASKIERADMVIDTSRAKYYNFRKVKRIVQVLV